MKLIKKFSTFCYLFFLVVLSNCAQSTVSLFGPALTGAKTGNIYQTSLSYASSNILKDQLRESPQEYIKRILKQNSHTNKAYINFNEDHHLKNKKLLSKKENNKIKYDEFLVSVKKMLK